MRKHHTPYAPEFRAQMVELVKAGRSPEELVREFEPTAQTIYSWAAQADRDYAPTVRRLVIGTQANSNPREVRYVETESPVQPQRR